LPGSATIIKLASRDQVTVTWLTRGCVTCWQFYVSCPVFC